MRQTVLAVVVALSVLTVTLAPAGAVATDAPATSGVLAAPPDQPDRSTAALAEASELRFEYTVARTPERRGSVRVDAVVRIPDSFTDLEVDLPAGAALVAADGFDSGGALDLVWDGTTAPATLRYTVPANRSDASFDGLEFVDVGPWALVNLATSKLSYRGQFRGDRPEQVETFAVAGEGYAGQNYAYLGPHEEATDESGEFTLVTPAAAEMEADPSAVFATLAAAREQLTVGARDDRVNVFVGPSPLRSGGTAANASGPTEDVWVNQGSPVDAPGSVWIHEYVHTRQDYRAGERMAWFDEASAEYYAALLALRQGRTTWEEFRSHVGGSADGVLADEDTWESPQVEYRKGSLVLAALDARIRDASDGDATLMEVLRAMNEQSNPVTYVEFRDIVADVAGTRLDGWLDRYVLGETTPDLPSDPAAFTHPSGERDPDGDGLTDDRETELGTNPFVTDSDDDGVGDAREVELGTDPTVADTDGDGLVDGEELEAHGTDPTEADTDGDGLDDGAEVDDYGSDPTEVDSDGDGLEDGTEVGEYGSDPTEVDSDGDGLDDPAEVRDHDTDPTDRDTDGDGLPDGAEVDEYGTDPTVGDSDDDGLGDGAEVTEYGVDPLDPDTDGDGIEDGAEVDQYGTDPSQVDTDGDGLEDGAEVGVHGTDPAAADTDGDGYRDGRELEVGTDPTSETGTVAFWLAVLRDALGLVAGLPVAYLA